MVIGGYNGSYYGDPEGEYLDDVELVPIDQDLYPVPECLSQLNPLPEGVEGMAGALDHSRKSDIGQ